MPTFTRAITRIQDADDGPGVLGAGEDTESMTWDNGTGKFIMLAGGGGGFTRIQDAPDLAPPLGANQHGQAIVWLWDANTNTGSFAVIGNLVFIDPPINVAATPISYQEIDVTWTDVSPVATYLYVYRSGDNVNFTQMDAPNTGTSPWLDTAPGYVTSYYKLVAFFDDPVTGNSTASPFSATATAIMPDPVGATNLVGELVGGDVNLTWTAAFDAFCVGLSVRRTNSGDEQVLDFLVSDATSYTDVGAPSGDNDYHVLAVGAINATDSNHITVAV